MGYTTALEKAYSTLDKVSAERKFSVRMLSDNYAIDLATRTVTTPADGKSVKDYLAVLLLHYLIKSMEGIPSLKGKYISFKELKGGEFYYPAFRKRTIDLIIQKYGNNPQDLLVNLNRLKAKEVSFGDCGIEFEVFDKIPAMVIVFGKDQEFPAEANILFDESIERIFAVEDIAVLTGFVAQKLSLKQFSN